MTTAHEIAEALGRAWDANDSVAVSRLFAPDADFVDVLGRRQKGRQTIEREHRALFDSIYAGSTCAFRVIAERTLGDGVLLVHSASLLHAPTGPRQGDTGATQAILVRAGMIAAFHNTVQQAMEEFTGAGDPERDAVRIPRDPTL